MKRVKSMSYTGVLAAAVLAGVGLPSARGAGVNRTWLTAAAGDFTDGGNWSGSTAPGSADTAIFDKAGTYAVTFTDAGGDVSNTALRVSAGDVTFGLKPGSTGHTYTLTSTGYTYNSGTVVANTDDTAAALTISGGTLSGVYGALATVGTSSGTVKVSGEGSKWTLSTSMYVGYLGVGKLDVNTKGTVTTATLYVGYNSASATGHIFVDGDGSTLTASGGSAAQIGGQGVGTLDITNKGVVTIGTGWLGNSSGSSGTVTVDGDGSTWNTGSLSIGRGGSGSLVITDHGVVSAGSLVTVGDQSGSTGSISVSGNGSLTIAHNLKVGGSGTGLLTVGNGGLVDTGSTHTVSVSNLSTVELEGDSTIIGKYFTVTGGTVDVKGLNNTVQGAVSFDSASTLHMTLNSTADYGQIGGSGTLTAGGLLKVELASGFNPVFGDSFHILNWSNIGGTFATVDLDPLAGGLSWDQTALYSTGYLSVVPEPGVLGLLGVGGMLLGMRRRRVKG